MHEIDPRPRRRGLVRGRLGIALFVALVVVPLVTVAIASTFLFTPAGPLLEVEMRAKGGSFAQVFWSSDFAMSAENSSIAALHQQAGDFERVRLALPNRPLEVVRFDPLETPGEVVIRQMRVLDEQGRTLRTIDPKVMMPLNQIAVLSPEGDGARVVTTPNANDAMLLMRSSWVAASPRWHSLQFVTPFSLAWIAGAVVILLATALFFVARDIASGGAARRHWLWLAALFVTALWAKLTLLQHYPVPVPFWDQWDGEALTLYIPWASDGVTWRQMFTFHNEHRIFFSRLLALGLVVSNGQWDPHLQIVVNAILHGTASVLLAAVLWMAMGRRHLPGIALAVALVSAPPFALENSLAGFQSAFYFLVFFSVLALWLMGTHRPGSAPWFLGCFCALCGSFTVAGGVLIAAGIGCVAVLRALADRSGFRPLLLDLAALAVIAAIGYAALPPPISYHEALKAGTLRDFSIALARNFAFPWINYPRAAAIIWLPLGLLGLGVLRRRLQTTAIERMLLGLGVWVLLHGTAMAYSRGAHGAPPASRYLDLLALGLVVNTSVLLSWIDRAKGRAWLATSAAVATLWFAATGVGIARLSNEMLSTTGKLRKEWTQQHLKNVRLFVLTDDVDGFLEKKGPQDIPYYSASMLAGWLQHPYIRRILPAAIRKPLDLQASDGSAPLTAAAAPQAAGELQPVFDSYAGGRGSSGFQSSPVSCRDLTHLRFELASSRDWSGLELTLEETASKARTAVRPPWGARGGWIGVSVRCPSRPFAVIAADTSASGWLAFRRPAEIAPASALVGSMVSRADGVGVAALLLVALALGSTLARRRPAVHDSLPDPIDS